MDATLSTSEPMAADPIPAATSIMADYDMGEGEAEDDNMVDEQAQHLQDEGMQDEEYGAEDVMEHEEHAQMDGMAEADEGQEHEMADEDGEEVLEEYPEVAEAPSYEAAATDTTLDEEGAHEGQAQAEQVESAPAPPAHRKSLADAPPLGSSGSNVEKASINAPQADVSAEAAEAAAPAEGADATEEHEPAEASQAAEEAAAAAKESISDQEARAETKAESGAAVPAEGTQGVDGVTAADDEDGTADEEADGEDESLVPACRLTFDEQDFVIFSSSDVPSYTTYAADEEGADAGMPLVVGAVPLAVPADVFDKPLDELFKAFRVKDSLGDFLQEGTELEVVLADLDLAIREDDRHARDVKLSDLYRLHKGLGLETSMHIIVSEAGDRFITRFHDLAAQVDSNASVSAELHPDEAAEAVGAAVPSQETEEQARHDETSADAAEPAAEGAAADFDGAAEEENAHEEALHEEEQTFVTVQEDDDGHHEEEGDEGDEADAAAEADETAEDAQPEDGAATDQAAEGWQDAEAAAVEDDEAAEPEGEGEEEGEEGEYEAYGEDAEEEVQDEDEGVEETADEQLVDYEEAVPEGEGAEADADEAGHAHTNGAATPATSTKRPLEEDDGEEGLVGQDTHGSNGTEEAESKRVKVA